MPRQLRADIHGFLHDYKKSVFEIEHDEQAVAERREKVKAFVHDVMDQKFHYHLHQKVDEDRADTIQLIHHYCQEALLPPVVERLAERLAIVEARHAKALELVEHVMEKFSEELEKTEPAA